LVVMETTTYLLTEPLGHGKVIVVNCLSGAVDIFEKVMFEKISASQFNGIDPKLIMALKERGYLFDNKQKEMNALLSLAQKYSVAEKDRIVDIMICPTLDCNLACPYCFQKGVERNQYITGPYEDALFRGVKNLARSLKGDKVVQLFGGEPLLPKNKPLVNKIFSFCRKEQMPIAITTNGTTLLSYKSDIKTYSDTIKLMQITIDGPPDIHNKRRVPPNKKPTFAKILEGIKFVASYNIGVQVRINIDKTNIAALPRLADILYVQGLTENKYIRFALAPVENHCPKNSTEDLLDESELLENLSILGQRHERMKIFSHKRIPKIVRHLNSVLHNEYSGPSISYCEANRDCYYVFTPDGSIYPCSEAAGHEELAIGSYYPDLKINEEQLNIWKNRSILTLTKCRNCNIAPLCGGGCSFAAYNFNSDVSQPYCHQAQKVIREHLSKHKYDLYEKALSRSA